MSLTDEETYSYIKNIKKWMECPVCHDKLRFVDESRIWQCGNCHYSFTEAEFLDDFVLWFCDGCGAYLNIQNGFNKSDEHWVCRGCGYDNDITSANIIE